MSKQNKKKETARMAGLRQRLRRQAVCSRLTICDVDRIECQLS